MNTEITANLETGKDGDIPQVLHFAHRSAILHIVVRGAFNRPQATGASIGGLTASCVATTTFGHAGVEP